MIKRKQLFGMCPEYDSVINWSTFARHLDEFSNLDWMEKHYHPQVVSSGWTALR